jgi:hypothetical protein
MSLIQLDLFAEPAPAPIAPPKPAVAERAHPKHVFQDSDTEDMALTELRQRRDEVHALLAAVRKTSLPNTLEASYLAELGRLQRAIYNHEHGLGGTA